MKTIHTRTPKVFVGSDFSQQEPRLLSTLAKEPQMIEAYKQGKDFYATLASQIYHNTYWDNMEKHEDGSPNPDGKVRRGKTKQLLLGILYGMGSDSLAEKINGTKEEAEDIINKFYAGFPIAKKWMDDTIEGAKKNGYVEDLFGRRRRLKELQDSEYSASTKEGSNLDSINFNPLFGIREGRVNNPLLSKADKYLKQIEKAQYRKDKNKIVSEARQNGIYLHSNSQKIGDATRQCINARVQGSASTMTKKSMILILQDEELNRLDFHMCIPVHDEIIGECPEENAEAVAERLTYIMKHTLDGVALTPFKCDPTIAKQWYIEEYTDSLRKKFAEDLTKSNDLDSLLKKYYEEYYECTPEEINGFLSDIIKKYKETKEETHT